MSAIEQSIEAGIRTALRAELDAAEKSKNVPVYGFWLAPEHYDDGTVADRKTLIPGVWVTARPYIPTGTNRTNVVHAAGRCRVEVRARVNPADDVDGSVMASLWLAVQQVMYRDRFTPSTGVTLGGSVIEDSDAGTDDYGAYASVTASVAVLVT